MSNEIKNVLWLTMDHVTFHHYRHARGARPSLPTYERLCREGTEFSGCRSVQPLCLPCRASMLTGLYSHQHGKRRNELEFERGDAALVTDCLPDAGVDMTYFGKNHSGFDHLDRHGYRWMETSSYGNPYMTGDYAEFLRETGREAPVYHQEWGMNGSYGLFPNGDYDLTRVDDFNTYSCGTLTGGGVHEADYLVYRAEQVLRDRAADGKPFLLRVDTWGPHHAYQVPEDFAGFIDPEKIVLPDSFHQEPSGKPAFSAEYLAMLRKIEELPDEAAWKRLLARAYEQYSYIDRAWGRLIDTLDGLGLGENTLVLMTADHGDALGSFGGMFDKCGDLSEELMEVPMVLRGPGVPAGRREASPTTNLDMAATVRDAFGLPLPETYPSRSLLALAKGAIPPREQLLCEHYGHFTNKYRQRALYRDGWKLILTDGEISQLYHIEKDPGELRNLAKEEPEKLAEMERYLRGEWERWGGEEEWTPTV